MTAQRVISLVGVLVLVIISGVFYTRADAPTRVYAATSSILNFQARLANASGSSVADGNYSIQFKLYDAASGGTNEWTETQASVRVVNGYFSVQLGSVTGFGSAIDWSQEKWLTMNVNGDGEMLGTGGTRMKLTATPYSFRSGQADRLTDGTGTLGASDLLQKAPLSMQEVNAALAGLRFNQIGSGGLIQLQADGTDVFTLNKSGDGYFKGSLDIDGASLNIGSDTQTGSLVLSDGGGRTGTLSMSVLGASRTYTLPNASGEVCLTTTCSVGAGAAFVQNGNSFDGPAVLGTNDNYSLAFETFGTTKMTILANGNVGIGDATPSALLSVGDGDLFQVSSSGAMTAVGINSSAALSVTSGGASISGGLNNNSGGISNAGSITGVGTNITASAGLTIASGGTADLILDSASNKLLLAASDTTLQRIAAGAFTFDLADSLATSLILTNSGAGTVDLNLLEGGLQTAGTLRLSNSGALQNITGLTVTSGGASITGNITLGGSSSDRLTVTGQLGGASPLVFQGATDNGFATTLAVADPTANNTITLPNASGTLVLDNRSLQTAAGSGLTGGGDLSANRSLSLDINGIAGKTAVNMNDYLAVHDATSGSIRKIARSDFLQGLLGALIYRGTWDASTNDPALSDATGTNGHMYAVSVGGTRDLGSGPITFGAGDFIIHNGTIWQVAPSSADVTSVFGRTGAVTAQSGDYTALQITYAPTGNLSATTVQAALNELDNEKLGSLNGLTAVTQTFANDTNITITSSGSTHSLGWSGQLAVSRGGTGASSFTTNGVLYGNGTGSLQVTTAGTGGQMLIANGSGVPTFTTLSGDATISATGALTISADSVALGTDTTGNYISLLGALTGLTTTNNSGEGSTPTLSVVYGSTADSAVAGNMALTCSAGTGNLTGGGGTITLGAGGSCGNLSIINNPTFSTSVTTPLITSSAGLSLSSGGSGDITLNSASNKIVLDGTEATLQRTAAGSFMIDLSDSAATTLQLNNSGTGKAHFDILNGGLHTASTLRLTNAGALQNITGLTVASGGASISGGFNNNNGGITNTGALSGVESLTTSGNINTTGGTLQTNSITRIDNSGNIVNVGNVTASGQITVSSTGAGNNIVLNSANRIELQDSTRVKLDSDSTTAFQVQKANGDELFTADTSNNNVRVKGDILLTAPGNLDAPVITAGANSGGSLSGSGSIAYYYVVTAIVSGSETGVTSEAMFAGSSFTPINAPASAPSVAQGTNTGITGTYTYQVTFVTANGETTASPTSGSITVSNRKINVSNIATGPAGTTARKLYRIANGGSVHKLVTTINDNTTTTFTDQTADASLGADIPTSNTARTNTNNATITFSSVPGATGYRIYRGTAAGGQTAYQTASSSPFTDTGATGTSGTPPAGSVPKLGINTSTPGNKLSVNNLSTADTTAQVAVGTSGANNKGILIQGAASQSADLLQVQNSTGTVLAKIDAQGNLTAVNVAATSLTVGGGTTITGMRILTPTIDPGSVAAGATAEHFYTVTGLEVGDTVYVNKPTHTANCVIANVRVSNTNQLAIVWANVSTLGGCDPASEVYRVMAIRS